MKKPTLLILAVLAVLPALAIAVADTEFTTKEISQRYDAVIIASDTTFTVNEARMTTSNNNALATSTFESSPADIASGPSKPTINANNINKGHIIYLYDFQEASGASAPEGSKWKIQLYLDGNKIGSDVYVGNNSAVGSQEGARIRWDLGETFSGGVIEVVVTRIA
jgi:hypothetical protein